MAEVVGDISDSLNEIFATMPIAVASRILTLWNCKQIFELITNTDANDPGYPIKPRN
ncbi:hypothetical protein [Chroococcidiopsis cubana]|uniref:hypothetical protein n=1 Tax=Chroococcidiopsis cubana TaxID=171392 RepID=UPI002ACDE919|nr:hypothetical protein [Chroococcidiopsis cubana]